MTRAPSGARRRRGAPRSAPARARAWRFPPGSSETRVRSNGTSSDRAKRGGEIELAGAPRRGDRGRRRARPARDGHGRCARGAGEDVEERHRVGAAAHGDEDPVAAPEEALFADRSRVEADRSAGGWVRGISSSSNSLQNGTGCRAAVARVEERVSAGGESGPVRFPPRALRRSGAVRSRSGSKCDAVVAGEAEGEPGGLGVRRASTGVFMRGRSRRSRWTTVSTWLVCGNSSNASIDDAA